MKTISAIFLATCCAALAQLVAPFEKSNNDLRFVEGKLYDRTQSDKWRLYSCALTKQIEGDAVVAATTNSFYVRHFSPDSNVNGLVSFRAMKVGATNIAGERLEMLDYGMTYLVRTN